MPLRNYVGKFRIDDNGDSTSTVTWSVQFDVSTDGDDEVVEVIGGLLKAGTDSLREQYGEAN